MSGRVIKYLGSKRKMLPHIMPIVESLCVQSMRDPFSGTARVAQACKARGIQVFASDLNAYAAALATCYVVANKEDTERDALRLIDELNRLPGSPGYFTEVFCERARYVHPKNGARVDAIREAIAAKQLPPVLEAVLLTSLMEAADRVDSTTGVQMAYLKQWAKRAHNDLALRLPTLLPQASNGQGVATQQDVFDALQEGPTDLVYLDPPYNQHSYLGNYHVWESLVRWDKPEVFGIACKRIDCKTRKSPFNSKKSAVTSFHQLVRQVQCRYLLVSFSDEGFITREAMEAMLASRGEVRTYTVAYDRYVGAQIGIYNPEGKKVGKVGHLRNEEHLYLVYMDTPATNLVGLSSQKMQHAEHGVQRTKHRAQQAERRMPHA